MPQIAAAAIRGALVTLLVALSAFGVLYGEGASQRAVVSGVIAAAVPVALGFLGFGAYDAHRQSVGRVVASDVRPKP